MPTLTSAAKMAAPVAEIITANGRAGMKCEEVRKVDRDTFHQFIAVRLLQPDGTKTGPWHHIGCVVDVTWPGFDFVCTGERTGGGYRWRPHPEHYRHLMLKCELSKEPRRAVLYILPDCGYRCAQAVEADTLDRLQAANVTIAAMLEMEDEEEISARFPLPIRFTAEADVLKIARSLTGHLRDRLAVERQTIRNAVKQRRVTALRYLENHASLWQQALKLPQQFV